MLRATSVGRAGAAHSAGRSRVISPGDAREAQPQFGHAAAAARWAR